MSQGDIGKEINMKQSAVCRAMKVWVESGVSCGVTRTDYYL
jgi:hypothetical protein